VRFCYGEYGLATATVEGIQHTTLLVINDELGTAQIVERYIYGLVTRGVDFERIREFLRGMDEGKYVELQEGLRKVQREYTWENHVKRLFPRGPLAMLWVWG